jgi:hypothetical protein
MYPGNPSSNLAIHYGSSAKLPGSRRNKTMRRIFGVHDFNCGNVWLLDVTHGGNAAVQPP